MTRTPLTHLLPLRTPTLRFLGDTAWVAARASPTPIVLGLGMLLILAAVVAVIVARMDS